MKFRTAILFILPILFGSCKEALLPKPNAFLKLEYPTARYQKVVSSCPFTFEISQESIAEFKGNCSVNIKYPKLNAAIHITYREVNNNLEQILQEVEKLTYEHTIKADAIPLADSFENELNNVYGKIINVEGDVASNIQFNATDNVKNVLYGSLYFSVKPNYDSILPTINYIEKDIKNLMESIEWK